MAGFLSLEALGRTSGNFGLLDVIEALKWVKVHLNSVSSLQIVSLSPAAKQAAAATYCSTALFAALEESPLLVVHSKIFCILEAILRE